MLPLGLMLSVLAWSLFVLAALGLFFWALRWFPRQPWFARLLLVVFVLLGLFARQTKWSIPLIALILLVGSAFIPRPRR
jgi:hypothetical protein